MTRVKLLVVSLVACGVFVASAALVQAVAFSENFDGGGVTSPWFPPGWSTTGWTITRTAPYSSPNTVVAFAPDTVAEYYLLSPPLNVTSTAATLSFRNAFNLQPDADGGVLEIALSGGAWQDVTLTGATFSTGGYTGTIATGNGSAIAGRQAWSGDAPAQNQDNGFILTTVALPASLANTNVQFRWRLATDSTPFAGSSHRWAIDDVTSTGLDTSSTRLEVRKSVIGGTSGAQFTLTIDGQGAGTGLNVGDGGTTGEVPVTAGVHSVGELPATGAAYATSISCRDRDGAGRVIASGEGTSLSSVNVIQGADVVCVITNVVSPAECQADAPLNLVLGTPNTDVLSGTDGNDLIVGLAGNDVIRANAGNDCILGGDGTDVIDAGPGADKVWGDAGGDIINAGPSDDSVIGGDGFDIVNGGADTDTCDAELANGCE